MQIIYLDTLLCVNLFIDYILLVLIRKILHIRAKSRKLIIASIVGATSSLIVLLPRYSVFLSAIYKIAGAIIIVLLAFGKTDFRRLCVRFLTFLGFSMILSASVVIMNNLFSAENIIIYNDYIYFDISPAALIVSTGIIYGCIIMYMKFGSVHRIRSEIHKVTLSTDNIKKLTFESVLDTGCTLKEPFSGLPVILTEEAIYGDMGIKENKLRIIPFSTAAGSDIILGFKPNKVEIDGKLLQKGCYIGICKNKLKGEIKSIMGCELLEAI